MKTIKFKRGNEARRSQIQAKDGEPLWIKDTKELWIGDGTEFGGHPVGTVKPKSTVTAGNIAIFDDTTGRVLGEATKASILADMATEQYVKDQIVADVPAIKVNSATAADSATSSNQLEGHAADYFMDKGLITGNYQEDDSNKVVSASGVKALYDTVTKSITDKLGLKIDKTAISGDISSGDALKVASMEAIAKLKALIDTATSSASSATSSVNALSGLVTTIQKTLGVVQQASTASTAHLSRIPNAISTGDLSPSNSVGSDGDVYIEY